MEVPTDPAYALGALISSALGGDLQGSLPEQDSLRLQRAVEQILNNPVPQGRRRRGGGLQGLRPGQNSTAADVEQIVHIPARGGLQGFSPGPGPGRSHPCRGADADSLGLITIEILQLQYIDQVVDVCCAGPASSCAVLGDSRDPTIAARFILDSCCMPLCATTGAHGR